MKKILIAALLALLLITPLVFNGCSSSKQTPATGEGFAIYLTRDDVPVAKMPMLSHVELTDSPVISLNDIISYNRDKHEIELTTDAYERLIQLQVPTSGRSFVVCVDKQPIYWGAFWTPISSQSFNGVVIMIPPFPFGELPANTIRIDCGYPSPNFYQGEDPRSNTEIMKSLKAAGKLK